MAFPRKMIVIGLTGPIAGGKGLVAEFLRRKGFFYSSTSDRVREEIRERGIETTREILQEIADGLRRKFGPEVLAKRTWEIIKSQSNPRVVIDSIRGEAEVDYLKKKPNFYLIGVTAPRRLRYQRVISRQRESDPIKWKEFLRIDKIDFKSGQGKEGRNIKACLKKSDFLIVNDGSLEKLKNRVKLVMDKLAVLK
ncbi:hypothetical protein COT63_01405 [Candidatus Shapirobacteria bacterium CG09_land_8_20_14_0_10_38_17]|uniref:Dephospho-CoA kinase n=1 Tax=Candidatus Shapirobacteria bacterium CG09_land_8_20_14_0_10_38_17 TaxID=1974884 RepID=A0A2H0WR57_9BACT|nr:MAG: hypothetical protein COT63_01405 [Candidatus Shapirobacteria bacterium CG09_land_8_20_14_0_10_38_17]